MGRQKGTHLHVVSQLSPEDEEMQQIMQEIQEENDILDELEEKIRRHKVQFIRRLTLAGLIVVLFLTGGYLYVINQTYTNARVLEAYAENTDHGERYVKFAGGILRYSRDGVSLTDFKGKELWNSAYQIPNPIISVKGDSAAIANKSGNDILVYQKKGLKGEIHTNLPVEKIAVSSQGIVSAVLKDGSASRIVCYDAAGKVLVEHQTSMSTGVPLDIDISNDGYKLLVSYLYVEDGTFASRVAYFNFGETGKKENNYIVTEDTYEGMMIPTVFFMNDQTSAIVGDDSLILYQGEDKPKKVKKVELGTGIKSVFRNEKYVGVILSSGEKNVVRLYNRDGEEVLSEPFEGDYRHVKLEGNQIILFSGKKCQIITKRGVHKFEGEFESEIVNILPMIGLNKYLVIHANGYEEVRLVK